MATAELRVAMELRIQLGDNRTQLLLLNTRTRYYYLTGHQAGPLKYVLARWRRSCHRIGAPGPNEDGDNCGVYFLPVPGEIILASICVYISPPAYTGPVENLRGVLKGPNTTCTSSTSDFWSGTTIGEPRTSCHAKKTVLFIMGATRPSTQGYTRRPLYYPGLCRGVSVSGTL